MESKICSSSKRPTTFLVVSFIAMLIFLHFSLFYQRSQFDLFWTSAKNDALLENVRNITHQNMTGLPQIVTSPAGSNNYSTSLSGSDQLTDGPVAFQSETKPVTTGKPENVTSAGLNNNNDSIRVFKDDPSQSTADDDPFLRGLLAPGLSKSSCLSRYNTHLYRKNSSVHKPSSYLISKLRNYEDLHRKCGPHTKSYKETMREVWKSSGMNTSFSGSGICKYIVWLPANGLGNRMISIAATFLYAVLTDRVLLVDFRADMTGLFCEPFPNSSWLLPMDFRRRIDEMHLEDYEASLDVRKAENSEAFSRPLLFLDLQHGHHEQDKVFHCDHIQALLQKTPALILRSDQYFVPALFMIASFQEDLNKMFPEKQTVFHHLGRYLFHPSNEAWSLITKFYKAHLAGADQRIGLQIRVFDPDVTPPETVMDQILSCTGKHKLLPQVDKQKIASSSPSKNGTSKAVLVASLHSEYSENLTNMYRTWATVTGEVVRVYQPSHDGIQKFYDSTQNVKALAEMYLLSLCDVLVTSGMSTFGYVAQGLGGLRPWILSNPPPCQTAWSMEPCFHFPPKYGCKPRTELHITSVFPNMKICQDWRWGVKLVDDHQL